MNLEPTPSQPLATDPVPDAVVPPIEEPSIIAPEVDIPQAIVPNAIVPETAVPGAVVPDVEIPAVDVSESLAPDITPAETPESPFDSESPFAVDDLPLSETAIPEAIAPEVDIPEAIVPETPAAKGNWQAVTETDRRVASEGWETTIPDKPISPFDSLDPPDLDSPDVPDVAAAASAADVVETPEVASAPLAPFQPPVVPTPEGEISRDDAWRKPTDQKLTAPVATSTTRPDVVDLAVPESQTTPPLFEETGSNKGIIGGALVALILFGGIIWLALRLFSNGDEVAETETDVEVDAIAEIAEEVDALDGAEDDADDTTTDGGELISAFDIRSGDCIVGDVDGQILEVERVDCAVPHDFEVYREVVIDTITDFDEVAIRAFAEDVCRSSLAELISVDDERGIDFKFFQPTLDSWNQTENPDRLVTCLGFDEDTQLIGRLDESQ